MRYVSLGQRAYGPSDQAQRQGTFSVLQAGLRVRVPHRLPHEDCGSGPFSSSAGRRAHWLIDACGGLVGDQRSNPEDAYPGHPARAGRCEVCANARNALPARARLRSYTIKFRPLRGVTPTHLADLRLKEADEDAMRRVCVNSRGSIRTAGCSTARSQFLTGPRSR